VRQGDQFPDQVRTASRHPHVGHDERRAVLASRRDGIGAGGRLPDDADVRLLLHQLGEGAQDEVVVVRDDDGDLVASSGGHSSTVADGAPVVVMRAHCPTSAGAPGATLIGPPVRARLGP
jgi:hypothetical protein